MDEPSRTTRLAPSPTGALHLGNARTFLVNWAVARRRGWRVLMRVEDLDSPRIRAGADAQALEDLRWLGLDWDGGPTWQCNDLSPYREALEKLRAAGLTYPCRCTRKDIERSLSAPHGDEHELRYPGTCRPGGEGSGVRSQESGVRRQEFALRIIVPDEEIVFHDELHGDQSCNVQRQVGDFVVATKAGVPSYQLAVVVDDARQGVTDVVRGDDLLPSTARQVYLYRVLGLGAPPRHHHLPLVVGRDGRRLAKRHGDTRIASYRQRGVPPEHVIGLIAYWCGVTSQREPMSTGDFRHKFEMDRLPRPAVTFTDEDEQWLTETLQA